MSKEYIDFLLCYVDEIESFAIDAEFKDPFLLINKINDLRDSLELLKSSYKDE